MNPFVHLHVHTEYSLLDGAARIKKLVELAKKYNMPAVAMTDHGNMYAATHFFDACKEQGIKPIFGTEFYVDKDLTVKNGRQNFSHLIILAKNEQGYKNLCELNTIAFRDGFYYKPRIDYKTLEQYHDGLICLSACLAGDIPKLIVQEQYEKAEELICWFKNLFGEDFYLEIQHNGIPEQEMVNAKLREYSKKFGIKLVATNDVHYLFKEDAEMQDVLMCVAMQKKVDEPDRLKFPTDELYFKTYDQMLAGLPNDEEALANTLEIAEKITYKGFEYGHYLFPHYEPEGGYNEQVGKTPKEFLMRLVDEGVKAKYGEYTDEIKERIATEINIIESAGFIEYFLIVWDYINAAKNMGISVGPGRGSGAGSVVAYTMGITNVDPIKFNLFFERFLNLERVSAPDFDVDFEDTRRDEVIDYVRRKYGDDRVAHIITFGTMKAKNAIKDVGRVLNVPYSLCDKITKMIPNYKSPIIPKAFGFKVPKEGDEDFGTVYAVPELVEMYNNDPDVKKVVDIALKVEDFPRQTSIHPCGVIIGADTLHKHVPLSRNGDDMTTQYEGADMEHLGHLKMDFLGLCNLTDIKGAIQLVKENYNVDIDFDKSNYDDPNVFKLISSGRTDGIFQIESAGFKKFLKDLQPTCIEDIVAAVALYRPGPMDSIPKYVHNKHNPQDTTYDHPLLKPILDVTYGCIVYQEQVMKICQELAGFTLGQADNIRRAMGKKKIEEMLKWKDAFLHGRDEFTDDHGKFNPAIRGCVATGISEEIAMKIWNEMETFAEYAFNKSHAAAYALIIYQTSYLKYYYPVETYTAILNDRITKIDKLKHYIASAKAEDISILPPDINLSETYFSTEGNSIRFGLAALKNVGVNVIEDIIAERKANGLYKDLPDFVWRVNGQALNKRCVEALIKSGAFDCFGRPRSHLMAVYEIVVDRATARKKMYANNQGTIWDVLKQDDNNCMGIEDTPLIEESEYPNINEYVNTVKLQYEHEIAGTYLSGHPLEGFKDVIKTFTFDSSMIPSEDILDENGEMDSASSAPIQNVMEDEGELSTEELNGLQNGESVICGGVITEIKTIQTKSGSRMAFATIEDMCGTFEAVFFNKTFEKFKDVLQKDVLICIRGKYTTREGRRPSINVDNVEVLNEEAEDLTIKEEVVEVYKPKKLCLRYNIDDGILHDAVKKILSSYNGQDEVYIKDASSGKAFKSSQTVTIRESLIYELETILDKANIVVKE